MFALSAMELSRSITEKKISVIEAVSAYMDRIEKNDSKFNAFITLAKDRAYTRAKEVQAQIDKGDAPSPLAGVPIALKDNISTIGIETTCASKMLKGYEPVFNATVVDRLEQAGMIVIGKLNMDEFSMSSNGDTSFFGHVRNPWNLALSAGGACAGNGAAVAAGEAPLSLASDSGGGIRRACSFCGATGIKPSYGAVSRLGLIANVSSYDQIGPMGKNIDDCAALLAVVSGADGKDGACVLEKPFDFSNADEGQAGSGRLDGIRIGLQRNFFASAGGISSGGISTDGISTDGISTDGISTDVKNAVLAAAQEFEAAGAVVEEFDMPLTEYMLPAWYVIACAEASSNMARFDGLKFGYRSENARNLSDVYRLSRSEAFGMEVKRRIMFGTFVLSAENYHAYYTKAMQVRTLVKNAYNQLFDRFDVLLSPAAASAAYALGAHTGIYTGDILNAGSSLAGLPAAVLPCGFSFSPQDSQGKDCLQSNSCLPIGLQLTGKAFSEKKLVNISRIYQSRTDHHAKINGGVI